LDKLVQLVEPCVPELAVPLDPRRLFIQSAQAELAGPHAPDLLCGNGPRLCAESAQAGVAGPHAPALLCGNEPRLFQDADMLLHAREGHVEFLGKVRDRSVVTPELLQNAASGGIRERGERGIETGSGILNHVVQYITHGLMACKARLRARW